MSEINPYSDLRINQTLHSAKEPQFWTSKEAQESPEKGSVDLNVQADSSSTKSAPSDYPDDLDATGGLGLPKQMEYFKHSPATMDKSRRIDSDAEFVQDPEGAHDPARDLSVTDKALSNSKKNLKEKNATSRNTSTLLSEILKGVSKPQEESTAYTVKSKTGPLERAVEADTVNKGPGLSDLFSSRPSSVEDSTRSNASTWQDQSKVNNVDRDYEPASSTGPKSNTSSQVRKPGEHHNDVSNKTLGKGEPESSKRKGILKRSSSTSSNESENFPKLSSVRPTEDIRDMSEVSSDYSGNVKTEASNKQVRFSTKMKNTPLLDVEEWKTSKAPQSSITTNEDGVISRQEEKNDNGFSSLSPAERFETKPYENPYLNNKETTELFRSPFWRETSETLPKNEQVPEDDSSDLSVKINKPTPLPNPTGSTVPILTSSDPQSEEYDYFDELTSESSFGSDILKQTDVQIGSNLNTSKLSGSLQSLYSDPGGFGDVAVQGAIQFRLQYEEAKKEFHIFVQQCQGLAAVSKRKYTSDPYVKTYLLPDRSRQSKCKTSVKKATLNPQYNETLKYKMRKQDLLNRTLNVSVWHNDTLGRNIFLGETEVELNKWDWNDKTLNWYDLESKASGLPEGNTTQGEFRVALKYIPANSMDAYQPQTGEVHIWLKEAIALQPLKPDGVDSFVRCYILPDTRKKSRQKTRVVKKSLNPIYNHTMVYDGFKLDEIIEASAELSIWDHETFTNQFLGGIRLNLGTGNSYGQNVDWMDSSEEEAALWREMITRPCEWVEAVLPLRTTMTKRK